MIGLPSDRSGALLNSKVTMSNLSEDTAFATLKVIENYLPADFDTLGITQEEFEKLGSPNPWLRPEIPRLVRTVNALIFGTLEVMTLPKLVVPAEYVAAVITTCVNPANIMACCVIMAQERQTGVGALELASRSNQSSNIDPTSADQLFALCIILNNTEQANFARKRLRVRLGLKIEEAMKGQLN